MILLASSLCGCGKVNYDFAYDSDYEVSNFQVINKENTFAAKTFAADLCVVTENILNSNVTITEQTAAALFDVSKNNVIYAKDSHEKLYPASLTKVMTAVVALKYGTMDQVLTATSSINITESGAQLCGIKVGDKMTLSQALHILLIYSANDVSMMIAEGVSGTVDKFVDKMNEEAKNLGATRTNFANPHGLTDINHYTTAYDLYLIFNEAIKYEVFREIIHMTSYSTIYYDKDGKEKEISVKTTNQYFKERYEAPTNVTIIGGKTGTTNAAGHCLLLLSRDTSGDLYISVILRAPENELLYSKMTELLSTIGK